MDFNEHKAIYLQIMNLIKADIISGRLSPDEKLPAVRDYALKLKVNPNTVQRSYQELERENIIVSQRGIGSFVTSDVSLIEKIRKESAQEEINNFFMKMDQLGFCKTETFKLLKSMEEI